MIDFGSIFPVRAPAQGSLCVSRAFGPPPRCVSRGLGGFISRVFGLFGKLGCPEFYSKIEFLDEAFGFFWHFLGGQKIISKLTFLRYLRDFGAFLAISDASETHFCCYLQCFRSFWVASNNFGNAFFTLFAMLPLILGGFD